MISAHELEYVNGQAYVPEHMVRYVTAVSDAEPFLVDDFLVYVRKDHLIFVGYPLRGTFGERGIQGTLQRTIKRFKPRNVAVTAPVLPSSISAGKGETFDHYYRLDLSAVTVSQKTRNMLRRAGRDVTVRRHRSFGEEHRRIVDAFLRIHPVDEATRFIFGRIPSYLASSSAAWIFEARDREGRVVAFDVAEFASGRYAIYMFNFGSDPFYVPGTSDLLLWELIRFAQEQGKGYVNLGLGINAGVTSFKRKWGGVAFLPHVQCAYQTSFEEDLDSLFQKL